MFTGSVCIECCLYFSEQIAPFLRLEHSTPAGKEWSGSPPHAASRQYKSEIRKVEILPPGGQYPGRAFSWIISPAGGIKLKYSGEDAVQGQGQI